jgi:hypothetical protein
MDSWKGKERRKQPGEQRRGEGKVDNGKERN